MIRHSARDLIDDASQKGFQVLSITNHQQQLFDESLKNYAAERGIVLIPGVEATLEGHHVLLYNFEGYGTRWTCFEAVQEAKGRDQLVIAPHPFFPSSTALKSDLLKWISLFDGIELNAFYLRWLNFNRKARKVARETGLPLLGNSDVHFLYQLGQTYSLVLAEKDPLSIIRAIRRGNVQVVSSPAGSIYIARWILKRVLGGLRQRRGIMGSQTRPPLEDLCVANTRSQTGEVTPKQRFPSTKW